MVLSDLPEGGARLVLRVITIAMFLLIPVLGDKCCQLRNQLKLLRDQNVTITSMTGWIKGPSSFITAVRMRRLPAGFFGLLMILAAAMTLTTDLLIAKFVNKVWVQDRCAFEGGLVAYSNGQVAMYPQPASRAYSMVSAAQQVSYLNGGQYGIYTKVTSLNTYSAAASDTMGQFRCTAFGSPVRYNSSDLWDYQIVADLLRKGLIYSNNNSGNTSHVNTTTGLKVNESWQLLVLSASTNSPGSSFSLRVAVDIEDTLDKVTKRPISKLMQSYDCALHPYAGFEQATNRILSGIDPRYVIGVWLEAIRGNLYDSLSDTTVSPDAINYLEWMMNSAVMIAGGNTETTTTVSGSDYGCIKTYTKIPPLVIIFVALSGTFALVLSFVAATLAIMVWRASKTYDRQNNGSKLSSTELRESVPNGLVGWMVHAAQEANRGSERPEERSLNNWRLTSKDFDNRRLKIVRANNAGETEHMIQRPQDRPLPNPHMYNGSNHSQNSSGYFGQKTGYASVNTREPH